MNIPEYEAENWKMTIDHDKCDGDGACADVCPSDVFKIVKGKMTAPGIEVCSECCACVSACPNEAITLSTC